MTEFPAEVANAWLADFDAAGLVTGKELEVLTGHGHDLAIRFQRVDDANFAEFAWALPSSCGGARLCEKNAH